MEKEERKDDTICLEIDLTEEEIDKLLVESEAENVTPMCVRTVYGTDLRFHFKGFYPNKEQRIESIKQSLRNVGLIDGDSSNGFFFEYIFLNVFEQEALLRGLNARYFFFLVELFRLQDHVSRGLNFEKDTESFTEYFHKNKKKERTTQCRYTLFDTNFTLRTTEETNKAVQGSILFYEKGETVFTKRLCNCSWSKENNLARYRICLILLKKELLRNFCYNHFTKKRAPSLELLLEENVPKKIKVEATILKKKNDRKCCLDQFKFRGEEVKQEYKEIYQKRKEPVKLQPSVWFLVFFFNKISYFSEDYFDKFIFGKKKILTASPLCSISMILTLMTALRITMYLPRTRFDVIIYLILELSIIFFGVQEYVLVGFEECVTCGLTVLLMACNWKIAWIPLTVGLVINWQLSYLPWVRLVKLPFVFLSYWNQHRQKQSNPFSVLLSPYRDWSVLVLSVVFILVPIYKA